MGRILAPCLWAGACYQYQHSLSTQNNLLVPSPRSAPAYIIAPLPNNKGFPFLKGAQIAQNSSACKKNPKLSLEAALAVSRSSPLERSSPRI